MEFKSSGKGALWIRIAATVVAIVALTGCKAAKDALDLRCQSASERIEMHGAERWFLRKDPNRDTSDVTMTMSIVLGQSVQTLGQSSATRKKLVKPKPAPKDDYCHNRSVAKSSVAMAAAPLAGARAVGGTFDAVIDQALQQSKFRVADVVKYRTSNRCEAPTGYTPTMPEDDYIPANAGEAIELYLNDKEIFLSPKQVSIPGAGKSFKMTVVNENLNCQPPGTQMNATWTCGSDLPIVDPTSENTVFQTCLESAPQFDGKYGTNLVGVLHGRYCLSVVILENKALTSKREGSPTNINRDLLDVDLWCHIDDGPIAPGVVIGGPRPNFREPDSDS